jgi:hypothetical protein
MRSRDNLDAMNDQAFGMAIVEAKEGHADDADHQ